MIFSKYYSNQQLIFDSPQTVKLSANSEINFATNLFEQLDVHDDKKILKNKEIYYARNLK